MHLPRTFFSHLLFTPLQRRAVNAMRFAAWDRLDAWEELELLQIGSFLVDIQRDPEDKDACGPAM